MTRRGAGSINDILEHAVEDAVTHIMSVIGRAVDHAVSQRVGAELAKAGAATRSPAGRRRSRAGDMTHWVADVHARRVPKFVIEATGLDTKKAIVASFGENAAFTKGKPLPQFATKRNTSEPKVKAKPPIVRKKGEAAA
jgi:hypothetical protein